MKRILDGKEAEAIEIAPILSSENWNEYQLPNGDVLKVKLVMTRLFQIPTIKDNRGNNIYSYDFSPVIVVIPAR